VVLDGDELPKARSQLCHRSAHRPSGIPLCGLWPGLFGGGERTRTADFYIANPDRTILW